MASVKIDYYVVVGRRGYWRPSRKLRKLGFEDIVCGDDGPAAWATAVSWNKRATAVLNGDEVPSGSTGKQTREQAEAVRRYPKGSVGSGFQSYIRTTEWTKKSIGNRNKVWWPAWFRIRDMWGDVRPDSITFEQMSAWRAALVETRGLDAAHKTIKIWRALWTVLRAQKIAQGEDPSHAVINDAPKPRSQRWSEGEVVRLVKQAWRSGYKGLACIIAVAWDSSFSPVDVRTLRRRHKKQMKKGLVFDLSIEGRQKTGRPAIGTVCARTEALIDFYLSQRGIELHEEAFLFCTRSGARYREDMLAHDFAKLRALVFPGDKRRLMDLRRSGAVEAVAGKAKPGTLSAKMANSIETSNTLHKTYAPVNLASVRSADQARVRGRRRIREETS